MDADAKPGMTGEPEAGYPISTWLYGEAVPTLRLIERSRWREVLAPLSHRTRLAAANTVGDPGLVREALVLAAELFIAGPSPAARDAAHAPALPPVPNAADRDPPRLQVNVRLTRRDHDALARAAKLLGARPTALARVFIVSGANRVLHEERRRGA